MYTEYICKGNWQMKSIADIKNELNNCQIYDLSSFIKCYKEDSRAGVGKLVESAYKKIDKYNKELERLETITQYERKYQDMGIEYVGGIDEVGRGPYAGPVVTACVILPKDCKIEGVNDSKKLSLKKRDELFDVIKEKAVSVGIGIVDNHEIDELNILQATYKAMRIAVGNMEVKPQQLLVDAVTIPEIDIPQEAIIKGDAKSISIGAASIIAKVVRDRMMVEYSKIYPQYGFESNVGYGSRYHEEAIRKYGLCDIHRRSFTHKFNI